MSTEKEILDFPKEPGDLELRINRYTLTNPGNDELLIKTERSENAMPLVGLLFFGGGGAFLGYIAWNSYQTEGYHITQVIYAVLSSVMLLVGLLSFLSGYVFRPSFHFRKEDLVMRKNLGIKKSIDRNKVVSIYVSKTLYSERGNPMAEDYNYWLVLKTRKTPLSPDVKINLFQVEGRDSFSSIIGILDYKGMTKAEAESLKIAGMIADYWKIPVKV